MSKKIKKPKKKVKKTAKKVKKPKRPSASKAKRRPAKKKSAPSKHEITINEDWCKGCGICVQLCPRGVFEIGSRPTAKGYYPAKVMRIGQCTECMLCELLCPDLAVTVEKSEGKK